MKKLKDYACTFKQAKRLKELGINQDSLFCYNSHGKLLSKPNRSYLDKYSAFISQELNEIFLSFWNTNIDIKEFLLCRYTKEGVFIEDPFEDISEAVDRAEYLINYIEYLKSKGKYN